MTKAMRCHQCASDATAVVLYRANPTGRPGVWSCEDHWTRVPCAIDDCRRTADRGKVGGDWLCRDHWRRFVPPHSALRRIYHRHWRRIRFLEELSENDPMRGVALATAKARTYAYWRVLVARARRLATQGVIDHAEIHRIMGWAA